MDGLALHPNLRLATPDDEPFLYEVYGMTWRREIEALPNPGMAQHFLRIQYTAHKRRLDIGFPGLERWVVVVDDSPAGLLALQRASGLMHAIEMTLLPEFRSAGIGTSVLRAMMRDAETAGQTISMRVPRRNPRAAKLYGALGFRLVTMDDLDCYFEWAPALEATS